MRFIWILSFVSFSLFGQNSTWKSISLSDGLAHGTVYDLLQDREGYLWMATKAGLNRYDGYNFKVFSTHTTPAFAITSNQPTALFEDTKARLWVGTQTGELNVYDARTQRFYHCALGNERMASLHIYCMAEDSRGNLWVGTITGGIFKIVLPEELKKGGFPPEEDFTSRIKIVSLKTSLSPTTRINFIKLLKNKQLVTGSQEGYGRIDDVNNRYIPIPIEPAGTGRFLSIFEDTDGTTVLTQTHQVFKRKNNKTTLLFSIQSKNANQIRMDSKGNVLILNNTRLYKVHYTQLTPDVLDTPPVYQSDNFSLFNALRSDKQGNSWVSTGGYGVVKEVADTRKFNHYYKGRSVWAIFEDVYKRLIVNHFKAFYIVEPNSTEKLPAEPAFKDTHAMMEDGYGGFWQLRNDTVSYAKMSLVHLNREFRARDRYDLRIQGFGENLGRLCHDTKGNLIITGLGSSVIQYDTLQKKFSYYSYESLIPAGAKVYSCYPDRQGNLWLGTENGLLKAVPLPRGGYRFYVFRHHPRIPNSLADNQVAIVLDDPAAPDRYLWVGTHGGGLDMMDKKDGSFRHFTTQNGLPSDYIAGMLADTNHHLWISTYRGLAQFNTQTFTVTNFSANDGLGLQSDDFAVGSCFKTKTGEMMFGGVNGVNVFQPADFVTKESAAVLKINRLKINNREVLPLDETEILEKCIEMTQEIDLSYDQNQVTFEYSLIDFDYAQKNRFRYQLAGIDKDWIEAGTARYVTYSQLPPGSYTFKVSGSVDGSYWSSPVEINLIVYPPFYRTWWAYLLYISVVFGVVYRFYQTQLNRVRLQEQLLYKDKEAERLAELDAIKTNFFANISHEFRTPLTLILGPMEQIVCEYTADTRFPMIQRNAQRLLTLINQLLDISKLEAGQMKPEITQTELVRYFRTLTSSFTSLAESRQIPFEVNQNQAEVRAFIDEDKVEKIITNLLSNAFKFTEQDGKVNVQINYSPDHKFVEIAISDTGIGIKREQLDKIFNRFYQIEADHKRGYEGTGIGLALVKELVEVLKGSIRVESVENVGTAFKVKLPIDEQTWKEYITKGDMLGENQSLTLIAGNGVSDAKPMLAVSHPKSKIESPTSDNLLLIIDDNADIRAYVRSIFEREYQILEAVDGQEGLELAIQHSPDIVICDLMMPRMDGFEFCKHLKSDERSSHIPVVMLTAKATLEDRIEGFEMGADEYLTKPFNKAEIQSRVKNLLKKQEKLRRYFSTKTLEMKPSELKVSTVDEAFLKKIKAILEENLSDNQFGVVEFSTAMNMSKSQLNRKLNALCNSSGNELIREFRLQRAAELLLKKSGTVSEIAYQVGYEHLSYFAKSFQEKFGKLPSEY